jgi:hypothetical protein
MIAAIFGLTISAIMDGMKEAGEQNSMFGKIVSPARIALKVCEGAIVGAQAALIAALLIVTLPALVLSGPIGWLGTAVVCAVAVFCMYICLWEIEVMDSKINEWCPLP